MTLETVRYDDQGTVGVITLNRPENRNGITGQMMRELCDLVNEVAQREEHRVVVLTGAGSSFCVGADLKHYSSGAGDEGTSPEHFHLTSRLHDMPALTVAAVNGAAAGAGMGWAMACDFRVATESAVFNTAFLDVAVAGDMGLPWSLPRLVGGARARELSFMPRKIKAAEAKELGLVSEVYADADFGAESQAFIDRLAAAAPLALRGMKQNYLDGEVLGFTDYITAESARHARISASDDCREAFAAFVEKRTPVFRGR
ncbi:MAG: enoyl-CoA hydratase-related protein [Actinomycetota bacterium]|nr:enoyl-CoA hydratase-related protein [Actinomycetota bacterium]